MNYIKKFVSFLLKSIETFLYKFDIKLNKLTSFIILKSSKIGAYGSARIMSEYISKSGHIIKDKELQSFIKFISQNWHKSNSQWGQDLFVMYFTNMLENGTYLEIGGADGFSGSNTYALKKHLNWSGTLVEPNSSMHKLLNISRKDDSLCEFAISPQGKEEVLKFRDAGELSSLIGFEAEDVHKHIRERSKVINKVKCLPISTLLYEKKYTYLSLDVEGAESSILSTIKWEKINKPKIITVEYALNEVEGEKVKNTLKLNGYKEIFPTYDWLKKGDLWFILDGY